MLSKPQVPVRPEGLSIIIIIIIINVIDIMIIIF
jgi:hypothetical protein